MAGWRDAFGRQVIVTPPRTLEQNPAVAAAIAVVGAGEHVYRVGGAQAVAALAYGTRTIPRVDKIVGPGNRWVASARADQQGQFKIASLPAGSFLAIAVEYVAQDEWRDPVWLERASKNATRFRLDEGTTQRLLLKLGES